MSIKKFTELYSTVYKDLYKFALCMMRNEQDAEDAVSEAVISAYENIKKLRKEDAFKSWIFQITANVCKRKLKESRRNEVELVEEIKGPEANTELKMDIQNAMKELDEEERYIIALSAFAGYNSTEIGEILHMNSNTIRSKRKRAIDKMSEMLKG